MKRLPIRGGSWNNGASAGVFALNLYNPRSHANTNIGSRPALGESQKQGAQWAACQHTHQKDVHSSVLTNQETEKFNRRAVPVAPCSATVRPRRPSCAMAKTYNHLFERIYDFEALHAAYLRARAGKRDRAEVQQFEQDLEGNLIQLQNELIWGMYRSGEYRTFSVYEPKERQVAALPFRDRVVQHALVAVIEPLWECRFIADSYACRPGRGTHRGADRAQSMLRRVKRDEGRVFVFKADISKYFASMHHGVLRALLRRRIACRRTLALLDQIIESANQLNPKSGVGLPIGNLTSQLFANIYLHELDEFVKHGLCERHYVRYMDDFVIIHHDKAHLQHVRLLIEGFLQGKLRLRTNHKTQVFPVGTISGRALDFLGYRIWPTHRKLRKSSIGRIRRTLRRMSALYAAGKIEIDRVACSFRSWLAHASHANAKGLVGYMMTAFSFRRQPGFFKTEGQ